MRMQFYTLRTEKFNEYEIQGTYIKTYIQRQTAVIAVNALQMTGNAHSLQTSCSFSRRWSERCPGVSMFMNLAQV